MKGAKVLESLETKKFSLIDCEIPTLVHYAQTECFKLTLFLFSYYDAADARIVTTAGYEGIYEGLPGCHKIPVMVYDMSTIADGTHILKILSAGYYLAGPCSGAVLIGAQGISLE